jgi:hypothetical protein
MQERIVGRGEQGSGIWRWIGCWRWHPHATLVPLCRACLLFPTPRKDAVTSLAHRILAGYLVAVSLPRLQRAMWVGALFPAKAFRMLLLRTSAEADFAAVVERRGSSLTKGMERYEAGAE